MEFEIVYIIYLVVSIYITIIVGNSLHKNGGVWIRHILNESIICDQINNLLLLAYRLLNIGYIIFTLMNTNTPYNMKSCFEFLSNRLGLIILILAYLHFQNIFSLLIFSHFKNKHND